MSHYISKVHHTNENGEDEFIYYCGNHHWSSNPANRLTFDTPEEAATHLYKFGGEVTDVEPAPYNPPTTTVEVTPVVQEEPVVTFDDNYTAPQEESSFDFSSNTTTSSINFSSYTTSSSFGMESTETFGSGTTLF
jgi:hypothetical protein